MNNVQPRTAFIATTDLLAIVRGRAIPFNTLEKALKYGVGWVPANHVINFDGTIEENPFGSCGDLRLIPVDGTPRILGQATDSPTHLVFSGIHTIDGDPWEGCPRAWLTSMIDKLERQFGLTIVAGIEHEFFLLPNQVSARPFSLESFRQNQEFIDSIIETLDAAGCEPETILPEFGDCQYELTCKPAPVMESLDRAIFTREAIRDTARQFDLRAVFSPVAQHSPSGNGCHVHMSFIDANGNNVTGDFSNESGLSVATRSFLSGVLRHGRALTAFSASTPVSYDRLGPHHWSSSYTTLGVQDRECMVRVCREYTGSAEPSLEKQHFEYRVPDAAANLYLVTSAFVAAGLRGLTNPQPVQLSEGLDPEELSDSERRAMGIHRLPISLQDSITALQDDEILTADVPPVLLQCFLTINRYTIDKAASMTKEELVHCYENIY
jgi:glutamine synthetase